MAGKREERRRGTPRAWIVRRMRLPLIIASIACSLAHADAGREAPALKAGGGRKPGLVIRVEPGGWGGADTRHIETVLHAVADTLLSRLPEKLAAPIVVSHTERAPVALYERGPGGEYRVRLHARGDKWHLYVYEFAHELCHILSNYEHNVGPETVKHNQWFEETLCETASLFTLARLAERWETSPPAPHWAAEARRLRRFFEHLIAEGHRQLPAHAPLSAWLREHETALRQNPYLREKNEVVANLLLPLFASDPQNWDALAYLNLDPDDARGTLEDYLRNWYDNAPLEHKRFVAGVLALLWQGEPPAVGGVVATAPTAAAR
ncbi:MAG: hypothetical protein H3C26_14610 [Rhodocyclaceae bacterium]|nr:hypothetical protein [Rhodocyclaceae bacterium]